VAAVIESGLDRLLASPRRLSGRRYGLLAHTASVTADLRPAHLALAATGSPPAVLFGPEHGYYGVEQDMVASGDQRDPWTGVEIRSLYGDTEQSLRPAPEAFAGLDLLLVDLQDVGSRYYTYGATAVWAAEGALAAGCEVWVLDRPNPLGGEQLEGNRVAAGFESFVGAFPLPVRHGLTLGELVRWRLSALAPGDALEVWELAGWRRAMRWPETGRPWIAPSPNMPCYETAALYPGLCLLEATTLSEGRGTTRPFRLLGAPGLDPPRLAGRLEAVGIAGVSFLPCFFRPQFQKHSGELCGGVELILRDDRALRPYRAGVLLVAALWELAGGEGFWRRDPYEFIVDRPAIDLLAGTDRYRRLLEQEGELEEWIASWKAEERTFAEQRQDWLIYRE
jgi:uncharacterized protein YbbC (DUF1343 family)